MYHTNIFKNAQNRYTVPLTSISQNWWSHTPQTGFVSTNTYLHASKFYPAPCTTQTDIDVLINIAYALTGWRALPPHTSTSCINSSWFHSTPHRPGAPRQCHCVAVASARSVTVSRTPARNLSGWFQLSLAAGLLSRGQQVATRMTAFHEPRRSDQVRCLETLSIPDIGCPHTLHPPPEI